ncbi:MAG: aminotransferase class V-fold PLP-dependent enzyme [Planctomycetes bacterium]|nr:aminotransferase class V-fold PLP-dependent enzyme [Planctomycetota bacterium]
MDWQLLRDQFPVTRNWAFLDHAAVAPLTRGCVEAIKEYAEDMAANGVVSFHRWDARIKQARALAGRLLNAKPLDVAFVPNTSAGVAYVAEGFPWEPGDNVITAAEEYPANQYPWMNLRDRGVEVRAVPSRGNRVAIEDIRGAMDARTRVVALSAVEFASGFRNDINAIGELCRSRGIFFFVDAIQSLGVFPFDVNAMPIDAVAADGHKWLLGPEGLGLFYLRREWVERMRVTSVGWNSVVGCHDFSTIDFRMKPHVGRWEGGTPNVAGIVGLGASLQLLLDAGIPNIGERVLALTDHLVEQATRAGWSIFSSRVPEERSGIVSLYRDGVSPFKIKKHCEERGIIVNVRSGRLRISPHAYNTFEEIDRVIECLKEPG